MGISHLRAIVHGRVQGVFFRAFVVDVAGRLGLPGYVSNLPDGSVIVEAEGAETALLRLVEELKIGPPRARVERVEVDWQEYSGRFADFKIEY